MDPHEKQVQDIIAARASGNKQGAHGPIGKGSPPVATQFKPGKSGNPKGKPPGTVSLLAHLKRFLAEAPEGERRTRAEMLSEQTWKDAMRGDSAARKLCWEYIDGAATQHIALTGANGGPVEVDVNEQAAEFASRLSGLAARVTAEEVADEGTG